MTPPTHSTRTFADTLRRLHEVAFRRDRWNIGIVDSPIHAFLRPGFQPRIRWFPPPRSGVYIADPFGIEAHGKRYLFYESFDYREYCGRLFAASLDASASTAGAVEVFVSAAHGSYPYVFKHEGQVYCVPETASLRKVVLYRAEELPAKWSEAGVLLDGVAALDSTLFRHEGRWWLFHTDLDRGEPGEWADLFAWHSDTLAGPWRRHERSPIKSDIASARPAGTPFVHEGCLYRPAQDCSKTYGGRVVINRVTRLTPGDFEETPAAYVEPDRQGPYPDGLHTLSALGDLTLVDGKHTGFIWWALAATLRKHLRGTRGPT